MLGQIGNDVEGSAFIKYLEDNKIDHSGVVTMSNSCTGQAYILSLDQKGDNSIVIVGGSNQDFIIRKNKGKKSYDLPQSWAQKI